MRAVVVGGGIAGVSVAAELAALGVEVTLVEAEAELARHTTGRSAAMYLPTYGPPVVRALTAASHADFLALAEEHGAPLLEPRACVYVARPGSSVDHLVEESPTLRRAPAEEAVERCPALRPELVAEAAVDDSGSDIDVLGLHQAYVRRLRAAGGEIVRGERVASIGRDGSGWRVGERGCDVVVDAAGAWGDVVATLAGVRPVGLTPLRRTLFTSPVARDLRGWPLVADADWAFYFKPEGGGVLVSPADETPSEPCDARPEEEDVARALDAVNEVTDLALRTVQASWAGLRTFTPDRSPVAGSRADEPGFAWSVGQGGYGIQMAPALARVAAALALGEPVPADVPVDAAALSPDRF